MSIRVAETVCAESVGRDAVVRALGDQPPLETGDRPEPVEDQFAGGGCRVDVLLGTD